MIYPSCGIGYCVLRIEYTCSITIRAIDQFPKSKPRKLIKNTQYQCRFRITLRGWCCSEGIGGWKFVVMWRICLAFLFAGESNKCAISPGGGNP